MIAAELTRAQSDLAAFGVLMLVLLPLLARTTRKANSLGAGVSDLGLYLLVAAAAVILIAEATGNQVI